MKEAFLKRPAHEWDELFGTAKAPATSQRSSAEWLHDPHALASGLVLSVDDPEHGRMNQMGNIAWLLSDGEVAMAKTSCEPTDLDPILAEEPRSVGDGGL